MSNTITSATHAQPAGQPMLRHTAAPQQTAPSKAQPAHSDTVQISAAAKALQETIETPAQTAKEAAGGDPQARRLLAKEAESRIHSK